VLRVDQSGEGRLGRVVPFAGSRFAARVLSRGNDLEILNVELTVDFLPAWQIKTAASPRGPGEDQYLFVTEIGQSHDAAAAVGD
jgi:hypothetical protein